MIPTGPGRAVRRSAVLITSAWLAGGCALSPDTTTLAPQNVTTLQRQDVRASLICGWPQINRHPLAPSVIAGRSFDPNVALAGFKTAFYAGTPPFACDQLFQSYAQGIFRFNVRELAGIRPERFAAAFLEVVSATPAEPVVIDDAEPWGLDITTSASIEADHDMNAALRYRS